MKGRSAVGPQIARNTQNVFSIRKTNVAGLAGRYEAKLNRPRVEYNTVSCGNNANLELLPFNLQWGMVTALSIVFKVVVRSLKVVSEFSQDNQSGRVLTLNGSMKISVLRIMDLMECQGIRRRTF
jgi:hypothetical protein